MPVLKANLGGGAWVPVGVAAGGLTVWNPTTTGLTKGSGVTTAHYIKDGQVCHLTYEFVFGAGSALPTAFSTLLPFTALSWGAQGMGYVWDSGASGSLPIMAYIPGNKAAVAVRYLGYGSVVSEFTAAAELGSPGWIPGDAIYFSMTYLTVT